MFRAAATLTWLLVTGIAGGMFWLADGRPWLLARWLSDAGGTVHALAVVVVSLAPLALGAGWVLTRWSPWPWVVAVSVELTVVVLETARFHQLVPVGGFVVTAGLCLVGLWSLATAFAQDQSA